MSGIWNRTLVYLGLREEPEELDELPERFVPEDDPHAEHAPPRPSMTSGRTNGAASAATGVGGERTAASGNGIGDGHDNVLSLPTGDVHVRAVADAPTTRAAVVEVARFDDVESVGARYRTGQPVLLDASAADAATARRVVDLVFGLHNAMRGELTKVGSRAFLVVPSGVALSADERRRLGELGYRLPTGSDA
jgi:FtsZ-interacting cell division protein YlmF